MNALVKMHLQRAQRRMKVQADKHRSERSFSVGDMVFLKLQPYAQTSVAQKANNELSFRYFGPFKVIRKINDIAYELMLPESSKVASCIPCVSTQTGGGKLYSGQSRHP